MIRCQITGSSPVWVSALAKLLLDHPRLVVERDSGNKKGSGKGTSYTRNIHVRSVKRGAYGLTKPKPKPSRLDGAAKMALAQQCWDHIVHKTDDDGEALEAIIKLIEYVERKYL